VVVNLFLTSARVVQRFLWNQIQTYDFVRAAQKSFTTSQLTRLVLLH